MQSPLPGWLSNAVLQHVGYFRIQIFSFFWVNPVKTLSNRLSITYVNVVYKHVCLCRCITKQTWKWWNPFFFILAVQAQSNDPRGPPNCAASQNFVNGHGAQMNQIWQPILHLNCYNFRNLNSWHSTSMADRACTSHRVHFINWYRWALAEIRLQQVDVAELGLFPVIWGGNQIIQIRQPLKDLMWTREFCLKRGRNQR